MKATVETTPPSMHALLYYAPFGSYVEILNAPTGFEEYIGKICVWTMTNDLIPLEAPRQERHLTMEEPKEIQVRKLAPGEKITLTIKGE
jgi:hypothetical protein